MQLKDYHINSSGEDTVYWNVLCQVFRQTHMPNQKKGKVLAVACGKLTEGAVLSNFFDTREIYALDSDPKSIKRAKENNPHIPNDQIATGDARHIQATFADKFDIITLRHPNPTEDLKIWEDILASSLQSLKDDGLLVISTFTLKELQIILRMCLSRSVKIPFVKDNKNPHPLMPSFDAYIGVIQKGHRVRDFISKCCTIMRARRLPLGAFDRAMKSLY